MKVVHRLLLVAVAWWLRQCGAPTVAGDCAHACGGVSVPYPFGLNRQCASSQEFSLFCNTSGSRQQLQLGNITIRKISVRDSTMVVNLPELYDCYDRDGNSENKTGNLFINLASHPQYTLSDTQNNLTVLGCDTYALISDQDGMFRSGCISYCSNPVDLAKETTCSGHGCCQASLPKGLKTLRIKISSIDGHKLVSGFNPCGVAFVVDRREFNISERTLPSFNDLGKRANLVLDWMIKWDMTCKQAMLNHSSYACGNNTECQDFGNGPGYRCFCKVGYKGNPYDRIHGCQDIQDYQSIVNGDGKGQNARPAIAIAVILAPVVCIYVGASVSYTWKWRIRKINFRQNGGKDLKQQGVHIFKEAELAKATENYDDSNKLDEDSFSSVYRGRIKGGTLVAVKKPKDVHTSLMKGNFQHKLKIVAQINHKNVVKLKGMCLETRIPLLVYEYISNITLFQYIHLEVSPILKSWKNRLKIAVEIALALKHMHSYAIIHGNIKSANILLDQKHSVKISDFETSVLISPEHNHVGATKTEGTLDYTDLEYSTSSKLTIKSGVYSFGVVLVELLTEKKPTSSVINKSGEPINIIPHFISSVKDVTLSDVKNFEAASKDEMERVGHVAEIAVRCLDQSSKKRPAMSDVVSMINPSSTDDNSSSIDKESTEETKVEVGVEICPSDQMTEEASQHAMSSCLSCLGDSTSSCF